MILPTPMLQLVAVVLDPDVEPVTRALLDAGVIDFIDTRELETRAAASLRDLGRTVSKREISDLRARVEAILSEIEVTPSTDAALDIKRLEAIDLESTAGRLDTVAAKIQEHRISSREAEQELLRLNDMKTQLALFGSIETGLRSASRFSYLTMQTGSVDSGQADPLTEALRAYPSIAIETRRDATRVYFLMIGLKRDQKQLDAVLDAHGWQDVDISSDLDDLGDEVSGNINARIEEIKRDRDKSAIAIREIVSESEQELRDLWEQLKLNELYAEVQSNFSRTRTTVLFSGWLPAHARTRVEANIRDACSEQCYLEWRTPSIEERERIPVELNNPGFLAPFELLVRNYSVPAYGTIDPTPLVAISYLAMFGLMFGDAGHGLVLVIAGLIGRALYRKAGAVRKLLTLLLWCGGAAVVTGVLFGSYFGMQWIPPLWFDYHGIVSGHGGGDIVGNIYDVLAITVYFGISIIGLGLILNWINLVLRRNWFDLVFDKAGVVGGVIYAAGVWAAIYFVQHDYKQLPGSTILAVTLGIPVLLLAFKAPLEYLEQRRDGRAKPLHLLSFVDFAMEWVVEILEVFSGYLANTLSFMRVAGLGIAHEALMIAFFSIAEMVGGGGINAVSIVILIFGNLLVILLEGLSAGIQSLRLNYYEFFSKYFTGAGRAYQPVSLRAGSLKE